MMTTRSKTSRKIGTLPIIKGMKPYGTEVPTQELEPVNLLIEEYEALRLSDYNSLNHHKASQMMNVSRPTFTRIYASSLKKIAKAFVEGRQIYIEGGKIYFDSDWYECLSCKCCFNNPEKEKPLFDCPVCGDKSFVALGFENDKNDHSKDQIQHICSNCHFSFFINGNQTQMQVICSNCGNIHSE